MLEHIKKNPVQFHIPGHIKGAGIDPDFREFIGDNALAMDLINIAPLDDLHHPHGMIDEAQKLAAETFGADYTLFSVQGTSGAIMTMIMSVVGPGDKIMVPRNVHKSIISAIIMSGAIPIFMVPEVDLRLGIRHGVSLDTVKNGLDEHPDIKALLVINPTYYGVAADLKSIVELAHERGIPVLVDEAQGIHIHFHDELPLSAMQAGADMAASSVHKLGGSMTQASVLNIRKGLIDPHRVQKILSMLTTTSTSYLLLASLDVARRQLALRGREMLDRVIGLAMETRERINRIPGLYCFGSDIIGENSSRFDYDPTKLCINVRDLGVTGSEIERLLREEFNIEVELSDLYNVLCIVSLGHRKEDLDQLVHAMETLAGRLYESGPSHPDDTMIRVTPELVMPPREAFYAKVDVVPLEESADRIIAESIMVYPPGIPVLLPGERITQVNIDYIRSCLEAGLPVQGPEDPTLTMVKVVKE